MAKPCLLYTSFHKSIREYYSAYAGKNADTKDLQQIVEKVSGKNLETFFRQWLHTPVNPKLEIAWKYSPAEKKVIITVDQLQQSAPFSFPFEVAFVYDNKKTETSTLPVSYTHLWLTILAAKPPLF